MNPNHVERCPCVDCNAGMCLDARRYQLIVSDECHGCGETYPKQSGSLETHCADCRKTWDEVVT